MALFDSLKAIQAELEVPKNQFNKFGNYNYRNAEDIFAAAKPLCKKHDCILIVKDEVVMLGDRYYVKATARISDINDGIETTAYAREELTKKGMDAAQITGAASSYARKYALNGLFCLDDVKDADYNGKHDHGSVAVDPDAIDTDGLISPDSTPEHGDDCAMCGATMNTAQRTLSTKKYGEPLCPDCQKIKKEVA